MTPCSRCVCFPLSKHDRMSNSQSPTCIVIHLHPVIGALRVLAHGTSHHRDSITSPCAATILGFGRFLLASALLLLLLLSFPVSEELEIRDGAREEKRKDTTKTSAIQTTAASTAGGCTLAPLLPLSVLAVLLLLKEGKGRDEKL